MGYITQVPFAENVCGVDSLSDFRLRDGSRERAEQDGCAEARDADRVLAICGTTGAFDAPAQEIPRGAEDLVTWDVSPDDAGHLVDEVVSDDEADVPADMAEQGRNDADEDLRREDHAIAN